MDGAGDRAAGRSLICASSGGRPDLLGVVLGSCRVHSRVYGGGASRLRIGPKTLAAQSRSALADTSEGGRGWG